MSGSRAAHRVAVVAVCGVALVGGGVRADVVVCKDGSRLVGKIEKWAAAKVVIATDVAGKLEIDSTKVATVLVDEPITIELASGDRLVGKVEAAPDGETAIVHSAVGDVPLNAGEVKMAWRPGEESPDVIAMREEMAKYKPNWALSVEAGLIGKEGNTDTLDGSGRVDLTRKTPDDLLNFYAAGRYGEVDDNRTTNEYLAGSRYENEITERWYWYLRSELEYDEFEDLDLRATVAGGVGYYWLRKEHHELKTSAGVGYRHESYNNGVTRDDSIADFGLGYRLDISKWAQFLHTTTYSPSLEDFNDYRLVLDTAMLFPLKQEEWKLKVGFKKEYNSNPIGDLDNLDSTYYANIVVQLK